MFQRDVKLVFRWLSVMAERDTIISRRILSVGTRATAHSASSIAKATAGTPTLYRSALSEEHLRETTSDEEPAHEREQRRRGQHANLKPRSRSVSALQENEDRLRLNGECQP